MSDQDKILSFLAMNGPSLPSKVAKLINSDILIASAHLSDLAAQGKVKISRIKIGGSPLYYLAGQEEKLYNFAQGNLNSQDFRILNLLKEKKVLREAELDLLCKVALRSLKDFAFPLQVTFKDKTELFWKWHLLPEEEANQLIKAEIIGKKEEVVPPVMEEVKEESIPAKAVLPQEEVLLKKEIIPEQKKLVEESPKKLEKTIVVKEKKVAKRKVVQDEFMPVIDYFFKELKIEIEQKEVLRKNAEVNFILKVPSVVGSLRYYCKAKNKAKCDEKDLSTAYMEAQIKKLPLLFLYTSELSKKAQEMLDTGAFENAIVKIIE